MKVLSEKRLDSDHFKVFRVVMNLVAEPDEMTFRIVFNPTELEEI